MAKWTYFLNLDLTPLKPRTLLQGAMYEPVSKQWFLSQAQGGTNEAERMLVHRYNAQGKYLDSTRLEYSHGSPFGVRSVDGKPQVWFGQDILHRGDIVDRQVMRIMFSKGDHQHDAAGLITTHVNAGDYARPFLDTVNGFVVTRSISKSGTETYIRRRLETVIAKQDKRVNTFTCDPGETFQGAASSKEFLFRMYGSTSSRGNPEPTTLTKTRWSDGKLLDRVKINRMGLEAGEDRGYEPEGLCMMGNDLVAGVRVGGDPINREFRLGTVDF